MSETLVTCISWPVRIGLLGTGLIVPLVAMRIACEVSAPAWQSGQLSAYASLLLSNTALVFSPFLVYAIGSFVLLLFASDRVGRHFAVRFGVYTGMVLCLQFILLGLAALGGRQGGFGQEALMALACGVGGTVVPLGLGWAAIKITRRWGSRWIWPLLGLLGTAFAVTVAVSKSPLEVVTVAIWIPLVVALVAAPFWALASYVVVSVFVYRRFGGHAQYRLSDAMCLLTWLGTYFGTLRISATRAIEQYAQLPPTPPKSCYVCTAAARGHPALVRSHRWTAPDGTVMVVNWQMRRFKAVELALAAAAPHWHSVVRAVYDRVGPPLAAAFWHPCAADLAYLSLKPAEWLAATAMRALIPNCSDLASRLYNESSPSIKSRSDAG
ncbi:MAG TPA: DUF6688 family protein [Pirellulales bacterium]|nr:DUF6688 family protein [Pirellulales bacterium]